MRVKSYFAASVEDAVSQARRELGLEALLMNSRRAGPETGHAGAYEVVFALPSEPAPAASGPEAAAGPAPWEKLVAEVADLRRQVERTASALGRAATMGTGELPARPELADLFSMLTSAEVSPQLAQDIVERVWRRRLAEARHAPADPERLAELAAEEIEHLFEVETSLGRPEAGRRVVALVGPPGSGKTTVLAKLALTYGLTSRRPTQILSTDVQRIAAAEQLRSYASILGVGFQTLDTAGALAQALEEHRHKDLILIDTPGLAAADMDDYLDLARLLAAHPEIDTHLVLTASMKSADLTRAADRFEMFRPRKLVFTRLDETEQYGSILSLAVRTAKPISFLSGGQRVPEDLERASRQRLVELLVPRASASAALAA